MTFKLMFWHIEPKLSACSDTTRGKWKKIYVLYYSFQQSSWFTVVCLGPVESQRPEVSWQSLPLLILCGLNTTQHLPVALSMSSHAPASLPCNGFTLPYNPFTPQCFEYPICCLSLWSTAPSASLLVLSPFLHPSLYPFRIVSMSLEEGDWCVSQRLVLSDAVRPSLSHGEHVM